MAIAVIVYALVSGGVAVATLDKCEHVAAGQKLWRLIPPGWECGARVHH
jgi:hypothetical protein